jgi:hypothetical protein
MRKLALIGVAVATMMGSSAMIGSGAMAQSVGIGVGPGGAGVYVDDGHRHGWREREYRRSRAEYRDWRRHERRRHWRHHHHHHDDYHGRVYIERD